MSTTPTLRDAARQARDALGVAESLLAQDKSYHHPKVLKAYNDLDAALDALTQGAGEALVDKSPDLQGSLVDKTANLQGQAGEAVEPVAWRYVSKEGFTQVFKDEPPPRFQAQCDPLFTATQLQQAVARAIEEAEKRMLAHISKVIWVERDRHVTLLGKCIAHGDKARADTYEQIARALDELHEGIQP